MAVVIHRQILREEAFLQSHYGEEFTQYRGKVRRYI
jgi:protein-S-isoprenylcysteine O-methyltransferase Ste14